LIIYKDSKQGVIFWRFSCGEYSFEINTDLEWLINNGYPLKGVIGDGARGITQAVDNVEIKQGTDNKQNVVGSQRIPRQRCLVHLQLSLQGLLTKRPKTQAGRDLLSWVRFLNTISNHHEANVLISWYWRLHDRHFLFVNERSKGINPQTKRPSWWYTHKYLRRAYRTIPSALPNMFIYLDVLGLPKDNNGLEGFFSQLDTKVARHRGLKQERKESLISWLLYFQKFKSKP